MLHPPYRTAQDDLAAGIFILEDIVRLVLGLGYNLAAITILFVSGGTFGGLIDAWRSKRSITENATISKKVVVGSTGQCNAPGQCSSRGVVAQSLARPHVELERDEVEVGLIVHREVGTSGKVLPQEPVRVLARSTLPGTLRIAEVDRDVRGHRELLVCGHLRAPVPGEGLHHGSG